MMPGSIENSIKALFQLAEVPLVIGQHHVVPLNELVGAYNLVCIEMATLTSEDASNYLLQRGVILQPLHLVSKEPLAGYVYVSKRVGYIFVEKDDPLGRRRFSVAHELGHDVLHFLPLLEHTTHAEHELLEITEALTWGNVEEEEAEEPPQGKVQPLRAELEKLLPSYEQMELEANQFAAELLMPELLVRELVKRFAVDCRGDDLVWRLATEMMMSRAAVKVRLHSLALLPTPAGVHEEG